VNKNRAFEFYSAFQAKDAKKLSSFYSENIVFEDPAFGVLKGSDVLSMWKMLFESGKDLKVQFEVLDEKGDTVTVKWIANYTFSKTKRSVENHVIAELVFQDEKIVRHKDTFDFYIWSKQAFGGVGVFLGWTKWFQKKFQTQANQTLQKFIDNKKANH